MRQFVIVLLSLLFVSILGSCSNQSVEEEPQFLDVQLTVSPEKGEPNEPMTFEAKITYGDEIVEDADDVIFEVWRAHDEEHEKIEVDHTENGIYRLEKSFDREGTYYIFSHVTARGMHNMPNLEFVVGQPSEPEEELSSTGMDDVSDH